MELSPWIEYRGVVYAKSVFTTYLNRYVSGATHHQRYQLRNYVHTQPSTATVFGANGGKHILMGD